VDTRLEVPALVGELVLLEPLSMGHAPDLVEAAGGAGGGPEFTMIPHGAAEVAEYVGMQMDRTRSGELVALAQVRAADGRAVGCTSYFNFRHRPEAPLPYAVEIGWTWLGPAARGTGINTEAKLLLLGHAFESWGVVRVDLKTDARNERSRRAIEGLGARLEGVLRKWQPSFAPGEAADYRDSAIFSMLAEEWPAAKAALGSKVAQGRDPAG
jgi:N-acetyltransferase